MFLKSKNISDLSDQELVYRYQKTRDNAPVGELFNRYGHLVFGTCLKYLQNKDQAKDAVLQIFEKVLTDLLRMKVSNFKSWLFVVSKNYCLMELRKSGKEVGAEFLPMHMDQENYIEQKKIKEKQFTHLEDALTQLNEQQRKCIQLFYLEDLSYQQIADTTGWEIKKIKSYIQNGKRNLKMILLEKGTIFETN